jgi:ABC-type polysaccharide/polyol phosphate export permease
MSGLIPWFYFSEAFSGATNSLAEYSYLVKKVVFEVGILPALKVASSIFVHLFFVAFIIVMCAIYGYVPDAYLLQILYYIICMAFLVLGLSYITSACTAFFKDMTQIVNIALTIGVWLTPIMWNVQVLSPKLQLIFRLNPMYYIVDGFRDSLLSKVWFWEKPVWTIYFWGFSILVYIFGIKLFNRLKVHFSDVL